MAISMEPYLILLVILFIPKLGQCSQPQSTCQPSRCGNNGPEIRFPFRLKDRQQPHCGLPGFDLSCHGQATVFELPTPPEKLHVKAIDYAGKEIQLIDPNNCVFGQFLKIKANDGVSSLSPFGINKASASNYTMFNCSESERSFGVVGCLSSPGFQVFVGDSGMSIENTPLSYCTKTSDVLNVPFEILNYGYLPLNWTAPDCSPCEALRIGCRLRNGTERGETECFVYPKSNKGKIRTIVATVVTIGTTILTGLLYFAYRAYSSNMKDKENRKRIETFLEDYKSLKPSRYSYNDVKHITDNFSHKLGEGAYGTVYRGKLSNDLFVAVKILNVAKGNGEEFINEVGTIGRIHHVNVVRLVGYCADGYRRALVYEFLPKGSLQEYVSSPDQESFLGWKSSHEIALGIAKGIEYLHQGCDQQILHFDIKPHNVLLDQNFVPKIADFGLAKLCSKDQSLVSMTTARGTMGYIAPEIFSRNFGNVSYKSDVYSFGMLLLEMVGGRKITDDENVGQVYYPEWIYNLLEEGDDLRIQVREEEDSMIAKRLAIVGLWCIQWHPADRPSMKTAVHMLEGGDSLTMPPNPFSSAGSTQSSSVDMPKKRMNLELESIAEMD